MALLHRGELARAADLLTDHTRARPSDAQGHALLARALCGLGRFREADAPARRWAELTPTDASAWAFCSRLALALARPVQAHADAVRAAHTPGIDRESYRWVLESLLECDDFHLAQTLCQRAVQADPSDADFRLKLAACAAGLGRADQAAALHAESARRWPDEPLFAQAHAAALLYASGVPADTVAAAHRTFGALVQRCATGRVEPPPRPPWAGHDRPRVALLSPDLRRHSVAYFIAPLLGAWAHTGLELVVVNTARGGDEVTELLRSRVPAGGWVEAGGDDDAALLSRLRGLKLDAIVELSGLTHGHRLGVLAHRPAPVQLSYLGYPHDTALPALDARLGDELTDPPGLTSGPARERVLTLRGPMFCYEPIDPPPAPARRPLDARAQAPGGGERPITFVSFNHPQKISEATLALWSRVLAMVPGSRLRVKARGLQWPGVAAAWPERFRSHAIDPARVEFLGPVRDHHQHLFAYAEADIALDTFPYHGATTTCEALLMGVPVVTLAGDSHAARVGVSLLSALGLNDLVARDEGEYAAIAAGLARDGPRLAALHATLRGRLLASPLADGARLAREVGGVIRGAIDRARAQPH